MSNKNTSSSEAYRKYSKDVPDWLKNSSKKFVGHMMKKIKESCEIAPKAISIATIRNGKPKQFYVESGSGKSYMVSINDTNYTNCHLFQNIMLENGFVNMRRSPLLTDLPFCKCVDWK